VVNKSSGESKPRLQSPLLLTILFQNWMLWFDCEYAKLLCNPKSCSSEHYRKFTRDGAAINKMERSSRDTIKEFFGDMIISKEL
jgi:hypothetical protein